MILQLLSTLFCQYKDTSNIRMETEFVNTDMAML